MRCAPLPHLFTPIQPHALLTLWLVSCYLPATSNPGSALPHLARGPADTPRGAISGPCCPGTSRRSECKRRKSSGGNDGTLSTQQGLVPSTLQPCQGGSSSTPSQGRACVMAHVSSLTRPHLYPWPLHYTLLSCATGTLIHPTTWGFLVLCSPSHCLIHSSGPLPPIRPLPLSVFFFSRAPTTS